MRGNACLMWRSEDSFQEMVLSFLDEFQGSNLGHHGYETPSHWCSPPPHFIFEAGSYYVAQTGSDLVAIFLVGQSYHWGESSL